MCYSVFFIILILIVLMIILAKSGSKPSNSEIIQAVRNFRDDINNEIEYLNQKVNRLEAEIKQLKAKEGIQPNIQEAKEEITPEKDQSLQEIKEEITPEQQDSKDETDNNKTQKSVYKEVTDYKNYKNNYIVKNEKFQINDRQIKQSNLNFESFITANLFNKIGSVAIIIGMAFFLKYAFDQNLISTTVQVLIGYLFSAILLFTGNHFNKKEDYKTFSQGLSGAGISISYISTFAAYNFYHLINFPFALILLSASTILAFKQSLKHDSIAVAFLGLFGGFLTPYILYLSNNDVTGFLTYLIFLNGWIIALLYKKENWKSLEVISLIATYIMLISVNFRETPVLSTIFLVLILLGYSSLNILRITRGNKPQLFSNIINAIMFCGCICNIYSRDSIVLIFVLTALAYIISGIMVYSRYNKPEIYLKQNIITAIVIITLAIYLKFTGFACITSFSIEAFILLLIGLKYKKPFIWKASGYIYSLAIIFLLFTANAISYSPLDTFIPVFNMRFFTFAILITLMIISSKLLAKEENTKSAQDYIKYCFSTLIFILLTVEINDFMTKLLNTSSGDSYYLINYNKSMVQAIAWILYSVQLIKSGINKKSNPFIYTGFLFITIAITQLLVKGLTFEPINIFIPVANMRFAAFTLASISLMYISNILGKNESHYSWAKNIKNFLSYSWCLLFFILINSEISDFFNKQLAMNSNLIEIANFNKNIILGLGWSLYSLPLIKQGLEKKKSPLLICGALSLLFALLLVIIKGFTFTPIDKFVFFFNPRMLTFTVLIVSLALITKWLEDYSSETSIYKVIKTIQIILSLFIFYILTIEIKDLFSNEIYLLSQNFLGSNGEKVELIRNLKQLAISGIWLVYSIALMIWGILKKIKPVRYIALGILGLTILKVFIYDLSFLGQLYRIISFIGLGSILILSSYFYQKYSKQIHELILEIPERKGYTDEI